MATRYWRAAVSGTWNGDLTTNWSATSGGAGGASVPTIADDVIFDKAGTYTITLQTSSRNPECLSLTQSAGTVTFTSASSGSLYILYINSSTFSILGTGTWASTVLGAGDIYIQGTASGSINTNGRTLTIRNLFLNNTGTKTLGSALTVASTGNVYFNAGTLNLNGFTLTAGAFRSDGGDVNATTRTLSMGGGNIVTTTTSVSIIPFYAASASALTIVNTGGTGGVINTSISQNRGWYCGSSSGPVGNSSPTTRLNITISAAVFGSGNTLVVGNWANVDLSAAGTPIMANSGVGMRYLGLTCASTTNFRTNAVAPFFWGNATTPSTLVTNGAAMYSVGVIANASVLSLNSAVSTLTFNVNNGTVNTNGHTVTAQTLAMTAYTNATADYRTLNTGNSDFYLGYTAGFSSTVYLSCNNTANLTVTGSFNCYVNVLTNSLQQQVLFSNGAAPTLTSLSNGNIFPSIIYTGSNSINYVANPAMVGYFRDINWGTVTVTTPGSPTVVGNVTLSTAAGSVYTSNSINMLSSPTGEATFINTGGKNIGTLLIGSSSVTGGLGNANVQLNSAVTATIFTLNQGILNLNTNNLTVSNLNLTTTGSYRNIIFGSNSINITNTTANSTIINGPNLTNFSYTGGGNIIVSGASSKIYTLGNTAGATETNALNIYHTSLPNNFANITTNSYFGILSFANSNTYPGALTSINVKSIVLPSLGANQWTNVNVTTYGTTDGSITTNGKTIGNLTVNNTGNTTLLSSTITISGTTALTQGNLALGTNTLSTFDFTSGAIAGANRRITGTGNANITNSWIVSNGANFTGNTYKINMSNASAKTFDGGGGSYGNLIQATTGTLTIAGNNQFNDISVIPAGIPSTIRFTAATTQTLENFTLSGTSGNLVTINSVTSGTQFNLLKTSGTVNVNYLSIQDSNASAAFFANNTSVNVSNNKGWNFTFPSVVQAGFSGFF